MSYRLCQSQLMELPVEQPCYGEFRLCGKEKKRTRCINILKMKIYHIIFLLIKNIKMLIKVYITALRKCHIFSNLFNSQRVGTPIIN